MVNWDPGTRSAISDLEVEQRSVQDTLYMVDYPLASGSGSLTVATVRPETMLADTAIAVNPADERYTRLIGETAMLPLVGRRLPIIADEYVKTDFGTGALKITPGPRPQRLRDRPRPRPRGDLRDRRGRADDRGGRRALRRPQRGGGTRRGRQGAARGRARSPAPSPTSTTCRTRTARGCASSRSSPSSGSATWRSSPGRRSPRSQDGQPALPSREAVDRRVPALARERSGPGASRASSGGVTRSRSGTAARRPTCGTEPPEGEGWERDPDVLDTWFSSALWPFATLGWPRGDARAARLLPDRRALDGARHHLPLGRPDGDARRRVHRRAALHATCRSTR